MFRPRRASTPSRWDPVVVVSLTRSGSTLLQRILCSHPQLTIWGEHFGVLSRFRLALDVLDQSASQLDAGYAAHRSLIGTATETASIPPQANPFDVPLFEEQLRHFIHSLFAGDLSPEIRWGFKEVHYFTNDLRFLQRLFPQTSVIVLVRRPEEQVNSYVRAPWRELPESGAPGRQEAVSDLVAAAWDDWTDRYGELMRFIEEQREAVLVVRYEDIGAGRLDVEQLFAHCGVKAPERSVIEAVTNRKVFSSDDNEGWSAGDRWELSQMIAELQRSEAHGNVLDFFYPGSEPCT